MENTHNPQKITDTGKEKIELKGELLEELAEAAHEVFYQSLVSQGYTYGPQIDDKQKTHSALVAYAEMPEDEKKQNRSTVQDIPNKLAQVNYNIIPSRNNQALVGFPPAVVEQLAEMEHMRWIKTKIEAGWHWAPETDKEKELHKDLLPWNKLSVEERNRLLSPTEAAALGMEELPQAAKEKDRIMVRGIPQILARAGYSIAEG